MPSLKSKNKCIAVTIGDPGGIGPEVVAKAILSRAISRRCRLVIIGDEKVFSRYCKKIPSFCVFVHCQNPLIKSFSLGKNSMANGQAALTYLDLAIDFVKSESVQGLVTAPISKAAVQLSQKDFHGHTEYLANAFQVKHVDMMFVAGKLKTVIATRHLPIKEVSRALTKETILKTIFLTHDALKNLFSIKNPSMAVCGLNPHAGEGGSIGDEEIKTIFPAINQARKGRINISGPFAADTLFSPVTGKSYDAIIAMYHDQGLTPIKTLAMEQLVNLTIGLPFIRTSPAHGTAFDIAGKNKANPSSMIAAINLASSLC